MSYHPQRPVPRWLETIQPGDVLRFKSGTLRTVLTVEREPSGRVFGATFPILHCSWTKRAYTHMGRTDLITKAKRGLKQLPNYHVARLAIAEMGDHHNRRVYCCDMVGVFE